ncbi:MAG: hypothetical protein K1X53_11485 [Candidatus Sumerlaeaceae bacterium]|nr:hypothetical protein [Candidatus Sumerlaeaceae bacterium]
MGEFDDETLRRSPEELRSLKEMTQGLRFQVGDLATVEVTEDLLALIDPEDAVKECLFPVRVTESELWVAMADPQDKGLIARLQEKTGRIIRPVLVGENQLKRYVSWHYEPR